MDMLLNSRHVEHVHWKMASRNLEPRFPLVPPPTGHTIIYQSGLLSTYSAIRSTNTHCVQ